MKFFTNLFFAITIACSTSMLVQAAPTPPMTSDIHLPDPQYDNTTNAGCNQDSATE